MSLFETYMIAWGIICVVLVPYLLYKNYSLTNSNNYYLRKWESAINQRDTLMRKNIGLKVSLMNKKGD